MFCVVWVITRNSFCLFNPTNKGHHSGPDCCGGFCIFNKVAIAIEYLVSLRKSVLSIWAQFTSCIVVSCIVFVWLICFLPVHQSWPLQGGNCRLGLPPWQVFIWNLPPYFKSNLSCIWNRFFSSHQATALRTISGWMETSCTYPSTGQYISCWCTKAFKEIHNQQIYKYLVRHDPSAPTGYPKTVDGEWPDGDVDYVGVEAGRGLNLNIPFCGPEVSNE